MLFGRPLRSENLAERQGFAGRPERGQQPRRMLDGLDQVAIPAADGLRAHFTPRIVAGEQLARSPGQIAEIMHQSFCRAQCDVLRRAMPSYDRISHPFRNTGRTNRLASRLFVNSILAAFHISLPGTRVAIAPSTIHSV